MNNNDREELAVMKNEIVHIKEGVSRIEDSLTQHITWEEKKYEHLDDKYAQKENMNLLQDRFEAHLQNAEQETTYFQRNAWNIILSVIMAVIAFLTFLR